jgi:catechol 2,3-dioxygenase-like lactoylglutathione lyase family enzyme
MTNTHASARFGFALEYVTDVPATRDFFVNVLGLKVDRDHPTFVQFADAGGASYAIASDERMDPSQSGVPELWWIVPNAQAAFDEMSKASEVSMPLRQLPFGTCFGIKDPSGQVHYLLEFAQQRPSQSVA